MVKRTCGSSFFFENDYLGCVVLCCVVLCCVFLRVSELELSCTVDVSKVGHLLVTASE